MEWAASKAGLIPENAEDAMAMRMVVGKIYFVNQITQLKFRNIERSEYASIWSSYKSV